MKTNIRKSVFETNSSSMHSVAIIGSNRDSISKLYANNDNEITVYPGEYGWGYETLREPSEKLSYIVTTIAEKNGRESLEDTIFFKWLDEMIFDYTGSKLFVHKSEDKYYPYGYVDHQSTDTLDDFWSVNEDVFKNNMRDLIFNDKYFIIIDNDNH